MKALRTQQVYIVDGCTEGRLCSNRFERMMRSIASDSVKERSGDAASGSES